MFSPHRFFSSASQSRISGPLISSQLSFRQVLQPLNKGEEFLEPFYQLAKEVSLVRSFQCKSMGGSLFLLSNDAQHIMATSCMASYEFNKYQIKQPLGPSLHSAALVVGNSYLWSMLADLSVDCVFQCDIEPYVLHFTQAVKTWILEYDVDLQTLLEVKRDLILKMKEYVSSERVMKEDELVSMFSNDCDCLGERHFLHNKERFKQCQQALALKPIIPVSINLFDLEQVGSFQKMLRESKVEITFLNLTNLAEWDKKGVLNEVLPLLPLSPKVRSVITGGISPANRLSFSLWSNGLPKLLANIEVSHSRQKEDEARLKGRNVPFPF